MANQEHVNSRPTVSIEYAGKWIAWNAEETAIVSSADTMEEALADAEAQGLAMPPIEFVPARSFVGGRRQ